MATSNQVELIVSAENQASKVLKGVENDLNRLSKAGKKIGSEMASAGRTIAVGLGVATVAVGALGAKMLDTAGDFEQIRMAMNTMLGDTEKAGKLMSDVVDMASKTPFELPELQNSAKMLVAFGIESEKVVDSLRNIGDVSAGVGAPIGEISEIFGKAKAQGRLFAEDINQLTGRGIPIISELAKNFGVAEGEIKKMVEEGKVGFPELEKAFETMSGEGGRFYQMMEKQSGTFNGIISNIKDNFTLLGLEIIGVSKTGDIIEGGLFAKFKSGSETILKFMDENKKAIGDFIKNGINSVINAVQKFFDIAGQVWTFIQPAVEAFKNWAMEGNNLKNLLTGVMVAIGVALGSAAVSFLVAQSTIIAVFALITGAVAFFKTAWDNNWGGIQEKVATVGEWLMMVYQNYIVPFIEFMKSAIEQIKEWWSQNGDEIMTRSSEIWNSIWGIISGVFEIIMEIVKIALEKISEFWDQHGEKIMAIVKGLWDVISGNIKITMAVIEGIIKTILAIIKGDWEGAWNAIKDASGKVWEGIKSVVGGAFTALKNILMTIWDSIKTGFNEKMDGIKEFLSNAWTTIKTTAKNAWDGVVKAITGAFDGILGPIGDVIGTIKGWINDVMDGISDAKSKSSSLDNNAFGGPVTQGVPTIVGERGEEVFVPHQSGSIKTMDQVGGGMGGGNFNITINSTVRNDQDTRNIALELEKLLSRNNLISKNGISVG